jgi:hypothetical protein
VSKASFLRCLDRSARIARTPRSTAARATSLPQFSAFRLSRSRVRLRGPIRWLANSSTGTAGARTRNPNSRARANASNSKPIDRTTSKAPIGARGPRPSTRLAAAWNEFSTTLLWAEGATIPHCRDVWGILPPSAISRPSAQYRSGVWSARFRIGS